MKRLYRLLLVPFLLFTSIACMATHATFLGNYVASEDIIVMQKGEKQIASWENFDVIINLSYVLNGDNLELVGEGQLGRHYSAIYTNIRNLTVYLFLLDKQGHVLKTIPVGTSSMWSTGDKFTINQAIILPEMTTGLSFGYYGTVTEIDSDVSFDNHAFFSKLPLKKGSSER